MNLYNNPEFVMGILEVESDVTGSLHNSFPAKITHGFARLTLI